MNAITKESVQKMEFVFVNQDIKDNIAVKDLLFMENWLMKMHSVIMDGKETAAKKNFAPVNVMTEEYVEMEHVFVIMVILEKHAILFACMDAMVMDNVQKI